MIPICYREAWANSRGRLALESQIAESLAPIPDNSTVLMYTSDYVGAIQKSGNPLRPHHLRVHLYCLGFRPQRAICRSRLHRSH